MDLDNHFINVNTYQFLQKGSIYLHGIDRKYRPIIIIESLKLLEKEFPIDIVINGISCFLNCIQFNMFLAG